MRLPANNSPVLLLVLMHVCGSSAYPQVVMRVGGAAGPDGVARVCGLCLALVTLSQGIPFIHAGDDLLRSKSLDRDSYNSGKQQWVGNILTFGCFCNHVCIFCASTSCG